MYHGITYIHLNLQQNQVSSSGKTVHTNILENNRKLHTFATTNSNFGKIYYYRLASLYNVHVHQLSAKSG